MYQYPSTCTMAQTARAGARRTRGVARAVKAVAGPEAGIRQDLVARIRAEIAAGTYDTPEKMTAAMERMIEDVE